MNDFPPQVVENVIKHLFDPNQQVKNQANEFLIQWKQSEHAEITAFIILQRSIDIHARQIAAYSLLEMIESNWTNFDDGLKKEIKGYSISQLNVTSIPMNLKGYLYSILVAIAIFEWPEIWPDFLSTLCQAREDPSLRSRVTLLGIFSSALQTSKIVPYNRLMQLRTLFAMNSQQLLNLAGYIARSDLSPSFLMILNSLLLYSDQQLFNPELLDQILQMTLNSKTQKLAFQCLTTVFLNRYDFGSVLKNFGSILFQFFSGLQTLNTSSFIFLVSFLRKYSIVIEYLGNAQLGKKVTELVLGDSYESVAQSLSDPSVLGNLQQIYSLIFSGDVPMTAKRSFWKLLEVILTRSMNGPSLPIFSPLLQIIRISFLNNLPNAIENGRILFPSVEITINYLLKIDPMFLTGQEMSLGLIYALGFSQVTDFTIQTLENRLQLSNEYLPAILFTLSRLNIFTQQFLHLALHSLEQSDCNTQISASRALYYSFTKFPEVFRGELPNIVAKTLTLMTFVDSDAAIRLCKICCLGGAFTQMAQLAASLIQADATFALTTFREMFYVSVNQQEFPQFFQPLFECLSQCNDEKIIESIFSAITALIVNSDYSVIEQFVIVYMQNLLRAPQLPDLVFGSIAVCRERHQQIDNFINDIQKFIQETSTITPNLFKMISQFPPNLFDINFLSKIIDLGILDFESTEAALHCTRIILSKYTEVPVIFWKTITRSTINAFIDGQHCYAFEKQTHVMFTLFSKVDKNALATEIFSNIKRCLPAAKENEIHQFVEQMIQSASDIFIFRQFTASFLVAMKRITETDLTHFNKKTIHKRLLFLELGDQEAEEVLKFRKNFDDDPPIFDIPLFMVRNRKA